jgi:hypothetical protein
MADCFSVCLRAFAFHEDWESLKKDFIGPALIIQELI